MKEKMKYSKPDLLSGETKRLGCQTGSAATGSSIAQTQCSGGSAATGGNCTNGANNSEATAACYTQGSADANNWYSACTTTGMTVSGSASACATGNGV